MQFFLIQFNIHAISGEFSEKSEGFCRYRKNRGKYFVLFRVPESFFLKLAEGKAVPRPGSEKALLMQITVNYCRDELRAGGRKMTVLAAAAVLVLAFFEGRSGAEG